MNILKPEVDGSAYHNWNTWNRFQGPGKEIGRTRIQRQNWDYPGYTTVKISLDTPKSPGKLKRLAITQSTI